MSDAARSLSAATPAPPYVAVIFTARVGPDVEGYDDALVRIRHLASTQPGYLGIESAGGGPGSLEVTVSYWASEEAARAWKAVDAHVEAQRLGRARWYDDYAVRVARVERAYGPPPGSGGAG